MKDFYILSGVLEDIRQYLNGLGFDELQSLHGEDYLVVVNQNDKVYWIINKRDIRNAIFMIAQTAGASFTEMDILEYEALNAHVDFQQINPE